MFPHFSINYYLFTFARIKDILDNNSNSTHFRAYSIRPTEPDVAPLLSQRSHVVSHPSINFARIIERLWDLQETVLPIIP